MNRVIIPMPIAESARIVLGDIDYAQCVSEKDNESLQAKSVSDYWDFREAKWKGSLFLTPNPYHTEIGILTKKFAEEANKINSAIILIKAAVHTVWFRQLCKYCDAVCFPCGKLLCLTDDTGNLKDIRGMAIFYKGNRSDIFKAEFSMYGVCMEPDHTVYNRLIY